MAGNKKASSGVFAALAALVLCIVFPRSTWGYIIFIVGGIWAYRALFSSASKHPTVDFHANLTHHFHLDLTHPGS